jgi:hypothetical protein
MEEDFYAMTFLGYLTAYQEKYNVTKEANTQNFSNCLFIFGLQTALSALIALSIFTKEFQFTVVDFPVFLSRYICAILLHL